MVPEYTVPDDVVQESFPAPTRAKVAQAAFFVMIAVLAEIYAVANGGVAIPAGLAIVALSEWLVVCSVRMGVALTNVSVHV